MTTRQKLPEAGIVTFHRAVNYGALLQTYALQAAVEKLGHTCEVIDYHSHGIDRNYFKKHPWNCRGLKDVARYLLYWRNNNKKYDKFRSFASRRLNLSAPCQSHEDLTRISSRYKHLICGSDQVWNYTHSDFDSAYFLAFEKNQQKKNAYAASFGFSEVPEEVRPEYETLLKSFNRVYIREKQGVEIFNRLTGRNAETALDPTLLLSRSEWNDIAEESKEEGHIFIYSYGLPPAVRSLAEKLSRKTGSRIIYTPASYSHGKVPLNYSLKIGSPEEFLGSFKEARYVLTNSYHGTIFSIIYNKPFFVEGFNYNSRISNLLALFELSDRLILDGEEPEIEKATDYSRVNSILENEKKKSLGMLGQIFSYTQD